MSASESAFWPNTRLLVHFVGVCGAGKTTLTRRLAARAQKFGAQVEATLDWDPHAGDDTRVAERAFRRDLDLARPTAAVQREMVTHSLALLDQWRARGAGLVLVDRWYETYDHLPPDHAQEIARAVAASGFTVVRVLVKIGGDQTDLQGAMRARILHAKAHRPAAWWDSGPGDVDVWAAEEAACQRAYTAFCVESDVPFVALDTTAMEWARHEEELVQALFRLAGQGKN